MREPYKALSISLISACLFVGCSDSGGDKSDPNWPPMSGERYVVGSGASKAVCSDDLDALNEALDAAGKNDDDGYRQALMGHVAGLSSGTKVLVLNFDVLKNILDLRVNSGELDGQRVYCAVGSENDGFIARHA